MGSFSAISQIRRFIKRYCNHLDIKIGNSFGVKYPVPDGLRSRVLFRSLYVLTVMPVTSAKRSGIFPRVLENT